MSVRANASRGIFGGKASRAYKAASLAEDLVGRCSAVSKCQYTGPEFVVIKLVQGSKWRAYELRCLAH